MSFAPKSTDSPHGSHSRPQSPKGFQGNLRPRNVLLAASLIFIFYIIRPRSWGDNNADDKHQNLLDLPAPWGYNKGRNVERARGILSSIAGDVSGGRFNGSGGDFTVVDYGADEGYFSVTTAKTFKGARVMGVELGGVGGSVWDKEGARDVLSIQEEKIREFGVQDSMQICQTRVAPETFTKLREKGLVSDYQYVLSVFHWFDLKTRAAFERTLTTLFLNARTTFIELPIAGDAAEIRTQVGYDNFVKWYDGRTSIRQIITESAESQGVSVKVTLVASVKWGQSWQRETFRVDVESLKGEPAPAVSFGCEGRREIYGCAERALFNKCG